MQQLRKQSPLFSGQINEVLQSANANIRKQHDVTRPLQIDRCGGGR